MDSTLGRESLYLPLALVLALLVLFAVLFDNGALLAPFFGDASYATSYLHELFHDGRHLLAVPCH